MKPQMLVLAMLAVLSIPTGAVADIYRWKDANGVMHFSNQPPPAGVTIIEKIEETPYDAGADRQRLEEERRLRIERQKLEVEERKADIAVREREAGLKLDEANRRLEEARQVQLQGREKAKDDDCDDDDYLRYGRCRSYPVYGHGYVHGRPANPNLYRGYTRENNSLNYTEPPKHGHPPQRPPQAKPGEKTALKPEAQKSGGRPAKTPPVAEEAGSK